MKIVATRLAPLRRNALWICPACRRGTLGESACAYCSAPRSTDARPIERVADPSPPPPSSKKAKNAKTPKEPKEAKERRARPRFLLVVLLLIVLVGGGLFVSSHRGSSKHVSAGSSSPAYVPPPRNLPAPKAVTLPAALTAAPSAGDVITPVAAAAVVRAAWDLRHQALADHDVPLMAAFETGPALEVDASRRRDPLGPANQVVVSVPHQTAFPAHFLAEVATTSDNAGWSAFLVFSRADAQSPWMLGLIGGSTANGTAITPPAVDGNGFLTTQAAPAVVDPTTVHALLAQYWRFSKDNGRVPPAPLWETGAWTNQFAAKLTQYHQGAVAENGLLGYYAFKSAPNGSGFVFPEGQGGQIVCSAIYLQTTYRPTDAGKRISQDAGRHKWGTSVPPGAYREITQNEIAVPCIEVPPSRSHDKVRVLGAQPYTDVTTYK